MCVWVYVCMHDGGCVSNNDRVEQLFLTVYSTNNARKSVPPLKNRRQLGALLHGVWKASVEDSFRRSGNYNLHRTNAKPGT